MKAAKFSSSVISDPQGRFKFRSVPATRGTLAVEATGFQAAQRAWSSSGSPVSIDITLAISRLTQQVTVTATKVPTLVSQTAESVVILSHRQLEDTSALTLDGALRQIPGFTLYRRLGSRVANPTTQGVSLRGTGANGASRALVLEDGIPLNDPFGGWVYWDRVPRAAVDRIEVAEGGASGLYGSDAMGGVVNILTRHAVHSEMTLDTSYGNENTPDASLWSNIDWRGWDLETSGEAFNTNGYILVPRNIRGPVDTAAGSNHADGTITLDRQISAHSRAFVSGSIFGEARKNGTPLQNNRTHLRELGAGWNWGSPRWGDWAMRGYGESQVYNQSFSAIAITRQSESLTSIQRVPAQEVGYSVQWNRSWGTAQMWLAGVEGTDVAGTINSLSFQAGRISAAVGAGGRQGINGVYLEDVIRPSARWIITGNARFDDWRNFDALSTTRPLATSAPASVTIFPVRRASALSPRLSVLRQLTSTLSAYASFYESFRAPTLNELYRPFRVGNVETLANPNLGAERLTGGETGVGFTPPGGRLRVHGTFFWTEITQPVANVTIEETPSLITDQRENLGSIRSRGIELEAESQPWPDLILSGGYQYTEATVLSFPADTTLQGLWVPEVPRNVFTLQATYSRPSLLTLGLQGRYMGLQYDDVLNQFPLSPGFQLDVFVSHSFHTHAEIYAAVENVTDDRYQVARVPYTQVGPPVLGRIGLRFNWGHDR